ncbi:IS1634 family transposase [Lachnoclostridium sp. An76]|uniref:IS1634 family transposase n=1 Tax=Lachnoclostridium sp. An76 TaxID=1965654 RepID=UPI000B396BBD|nr:IS1634 family transposase [Lachnoclostridium sp. An76]OUN32726.1 transposase [Lachnoclostridium sp. An76]OUN34234.1 transposase [Lachnoclostridium sp. An76]
MKLYFDKRLKDPTYYGQQGFRNGKKVTSKNIIKFGKHSELLKITDDPEAYVREEIRKWNEEYRSGKVEYTLSADFNQRVPHTNDPASSSTWLNIGYFFLQELMKGLRLRDFFHQKTKDRKITFDCYTISRFLTYARILDPLSKHATWHKLDTYYEQPDFDYQHILRFMDLLEENHDDYLAWLFRQSNTIVKRDTSVLYYDCSNFYFESEQPDEDVVDEVTGEIMKGMRQYGFSKEHRPNPIVEMGLFMDSRGIPITMCLHPGNTSEQLTAIPLEKEVMKMLPDAKFIYCADAGLGSYNIRKFNSMGGRTFIVTQSIKKMSGVLKQSVFNDYDYRLLSNDKPVTIAGMKSFDRFEEENLKLYNDFAYKVVDADKVLDLGLYEDVTLKNGRTMKRKAKGVLKQRIIITFSRKVMEYQRSVRSRQIERAKKLLELKDPEEIKKGPNDVKRFLKRTAKTKSGETAVVEYILDQDKIAEEEKYDGYYAVATNLQDHAKDILAVSNKRYQIEECFRIMKTNFDGRPVNHRLQERIKAHFLICYTALLVYRLLEARLDDQGTHVTASNLITTLKNMNVANVHDIEYMALYNGSKALDALTRLTMLPLDRLHYRPKELNSMIKKFLQ